MPLKYRRCKAVFVYAMNPKVMCGVERPNVFIVHPLSGPFKNSDRSFNPSEHMLTNPEEMERAAAVLDLFPQVGFV